MTRSEFRIVPIAALTAAISATADSGQVHRLTSTLPAPAMRGHPTQWRGFAAPLVLFDDGLARRYDATRLAPYEKSRRRMHRLMLESSVRCVGWQWPALNLGMDGQLELQWWHGTKSLTLVVDGSKVSYLRAWGEDVQSEMEDGEVVDSPDFQNLWRWLQE